MSYTPPSDQVLTALIPTEVAMIVRVALLGSAGGGAGVTFRFKAGDRVLPASRRHRVVSARPRCWLETWSAFDDEQSDALAKRSRLSPLRPSFAAEYLLRGGGAHQRTRERFSLRAEHGV